MKSDPNKPLITLTLFHTLQLDPKTMQILANPQSSFHIFCNWLKMNSHFPSLCSTVYDRVKAVFLLQCLQGNTLSLGDLTCQDQSRSRSFPLGMSRPLKIEINSS